MDCQADVLFSFPFVADDVIFLEGLHKVVSIFFANVLDTEIIDNEAEAYWSPIVFLE